MNDDVLDLDIANDHNKPEYEMVGLNKFILLTFLSLGLYELWWTYKAWKFFKEKESLDINPAARTIFAIFFLYGLFDKIKTFANLHGYGTSYSSGLLVAVIIILNLLSRLPDPLWIISFAAVCCFIPPVNALNYAVQHSKQYSVIINTGLNNRQLAIVILGGMAWLLIVVGLVMA